MREGAYQRWQAPINTNELWNLAAWLVIAATSVRLWLTQFPFPTGLDGAQWLALGRGFRGQGRSSESTYAPLVPAIAAVLQPALGSLATVRALAALSALAMFSAIWIVSRSALGPKWGFVVVALVVPASALAEPLLFGGYPQQMAFGLGIVALWAIVSLLEAPNQRESTKLGVVLGLAAMLTAASHLIYFPLFLTCGVTAVLLCFARRTTVRRSNLAIAALAVAPALVMLAFVAVSFLRLGYQAPIGPTAQSPSNAWAYATREAPLLWGLLAACALIASLALCRGPMTKAWLIGASVGLTTAAALLASGQPRLVPPLLLAIALLVALAGKALASRVPRAGMACFGLVLAISVFLAWRSYPAVSAYAAFYRVLDQSTIQAAQALTASAAPGGIAVRRDQRGWPVGWWLEALQARPVLTDSNAAWLAFPDERERAARASALFDISLTAAELQTLAAADGVAFLVMRKWEWIGWDRWLDNPAYRMVVLYDDDVTIVIQLIR